MIISVSRRTGVPAFYSEWFFNRLREGRRYCYANYNHSAIGGNVARHDALSPLISGGMEDGDKVFER